MHDGTVQASGTYAELVARGVDFVGLLNEDQEKVNGDDDVDQAKEVNGPAGQLTDGDEVEGEAEAAEESEAAEKERKAKGKLIDDEERRTGAVEWRVYGQYLMGTGGIAFLMLMLAISLVFEGTEAFSRLWLAFWSSDAKADTTLHLSVYLGAAITSSLLAFSRQFLWTKGTLDCALQLHDRLLSAILRAPMTFFFTTPTGRIITRFSKDQGVVDQEIPDMVSDFFLCLFASLGTLLMICGVLPWFLLPVFPIIAVYWWIQQFYRKTSRELGRLESMTSSPIYAQYTETLEGLDTIRAFHCQPQLKRENARLLVDNLRAYFCLFTANRWLGARVEAVGTGIILIIAALCVATRGALSVGFVGLILALANNSNMNRVERLLHYTATPPEAPLALARGQRWDPKLRQIVSTTGVDVEEGLEADDDDEGEQWPTEGRIEFRDVWMRYRDELGHVLKGIDLVIQPHHKGTTHDARTAHDTTQHDTC
ncbi:ABC transporter transmembrane region domain containing protein, partial [Acanthamoeba castellanii str. Neff]